MKNTKNFALILAVLIVGSGCAMRSKILDAQAVSMTRQSLKDGESLKETGPVKGEFCADSMRDKGTVGLMDEAIKSAQTQHNVDFITNAIFYARGSCVEVEGTGQKVVASGSGSAAESTSGDSKKKKR